MKNAIILHGIVDGGADKLFAYCDSPSNDNWLPWLQWEFIKRGILAQTPEMPRPYLVGGMDYDEWARVFEQFEVNENTILVGHSCGGGFLMKYLSQNPGIKIGQLILVAPWLDVDGEHPSFHRGYDLAADLPARARRIDIFESSDDMDIIIESVAKLRTVYGDKINYHSFSDKEHFCFKEFPELLEVIK